MKRRIFTAILALTAALLLAVSCNQEAGNGTSGYSTVGGAEHFREHAVGAAAAAYCKTVAAVGGNNPVFVRQGHAQACLACLLAVCKMGCSVYEALLEQLLGLFLKEP